MGDKHKSEIVKPVKNSLLSGASHGFPFENFQGSSMLIPVSQGSPSVLNDSVAEVSSGSNENGSNSEDINQLTHGVGAASIGETSNQESKPPIQTTSQGYAGIFSSFFGVGSQNKNKAEEKKVEPSSTHSSSSSITSTSYVQTLSPVLQVPADSIDITQSTVSSNPTGFFHSSESLFQKTQTNPLTPPQYFEIPTTNINPADSSSFQQVEFSNMVPTSQIPSQHEKNEMSNFFSKNNNPGYNFQSSAYPSNIGFESFEDSKPKIPPSGGNLFKAHSAVDLPVGCISEAFPQFVNPNQSQSTASSSQMFYQTRTASVDSFKPAPPSMMAAPAPLNATSTPPAGPPMASGSSLRNYRRDHHKRLTYAPLPGLTSNVAVSSPYLIQTNNFPQSSATSFQSTEDVSNISNQSFASSLTPDADSNVSLKAPSPGTSLRNFFVPSSSTSQSSSNNLPSTAPTYEPTPTLFSQSVEPDHQKVKAFNFSSPPMTTNYGQTQHSSPPTTTNYSQTQHSSPHPSPQGVGTSYLANQVLVHPPIMSTKEQASGALSSSDRPPSPSVIPASLDNLANHGTSVYRPPYHHWFIACENKDGKEIWQPFSLTDSIALEQSFNSRSLTQSTVVSTDGGRYDVNVTDRIRTAVYWEEKPKKVMRCSWYYKSNTDSRYYPYDENTAANLEEEYKKSYNTNTWNKRVDLPTGNSVVFVGPNNIVLHSYTPQAPDEWDAEADFTQDVSKRKTSVKRGALDDIEIEDGESPNIDHLIFVVHGIGSVCDLKFRTIEEAGDSSYVAGSPPISKRLSLVDGFRSKTLQLMKAHYKTSIEQGNVNRIEILPVSWHSQLHGEATGVDEKLKMITLKSIQRLRNFTNDTLLDILFYTSPVYCQNIIEQVGKEMNTLYAKFKARNPNFKGGVSLVGHSLGSLILFDMLCHQKAAAAVSETVSEEAILNEMSQGPADHVHLGGTGRSLSRKVSFLIGPAGTGQPYIEYPSLHFQPSAFFALGSPIGMFVTVRGIDSLGLNFSLPTCPQFFNIFHPFDPVAYRVEPLVSPDLAEKRPALIPHHKGRKRMHLELKETMARVGADLKQRLIESVRSTWNTVYQLTTFGRADDGLEQEVDQVIEKQLERQQTENSPPSFNEYYDSDFNAGRLNQGRRIDYVLQEAPFESFIEYASAVRSHVIYWDSDDTLLMILKETYANMGISLDSQISGSVQGNEDIVMPSTSAFNPDDNTSTSSYGKPPAPYGFK